MGGYRESRRCSRDTYPESYITKYTLVYEDDLVSAHEQRGAEWIVRKHNLFVYVFEAHRLLYHSA